MYSGGLGGGAVGAVTTVAGVAALPNTGDSHLLMVTSIVSITVGAIILLSTVARFIAKKSFKS